jgi:SAM-dependent methyltransferase
MSAVKNRLLAIARSPYLFRGYIQLSRADKHNCPLCGYTGQFWPFGDPPRRGAVCAGCNCMERHRLIGLWAAANVDKLSDARILHFAPESVLARLFGKHTTKYRSADLNPKAADVVINIEDIDLPDESVDVVVCSHVLEHVDDAKALCQMHRILAPGGVALLMFPIIEGWEHTYENSAFTSHAERRRHFGQWDHVRFYGSDARDRIREAGFTLTEFTAEAPDIHRYGLSRGEKLFIATKH